MDEVLLSLRRCCRTMPLRPAPRLLPTVGPRVGESSGESNGRPCGSSEGRKPSWNIGFSDNGVGSADCLNAGCISSEGRSRGVEDGSARWGVLAATGDGASSESSKNVDVAVSSCTDG